MQVRPGSGPRHFLFHPNGNFAYLITELSSTVMVFSYDPLQGQLQEIQTVATIPKSFTKKNRGAELQITPSGKFLYASNRGHDSIIAFAIDEVSGKLSYINHTSTQGHTPRHFIIDPLGSLLLVANCTSNSIVSFHVNAEQGGLTPTAYITETPAPVCLKFASFLYKE